MKSVERNDIGSWKEFQQLGVQLGLSLPNASKDGLRCAFFVWKVSSSHAFAGELALAALAAQAISGPLWSVSTAASLAISYSLSTHRTCTCKRLWMLGRGRAFIARTVLSAPSVLLCHMVDTLGCRKCITLYTLHLKLYVHALET